MGTSDDKVDRLSRLPRPLLRRLDQAAAAVILTVSLAAIMVSLYVRGAHRGRLIEIDRAEPQSVEFKVDINAADWPELTLLPGIGETLARRIVQSREEDGPFLDHDDLRRVHGIGPKTLDAVQPYLLPMPNADGLVGR
jgi:competence protein ComEA